MTGQRHAGGAPGANARITSSTRAWVCGLLLTGLALLAAWRIVALAEAGRTAASDPSHALRWWPDHPQALLHIAEQDLAAGRIDEAKASARRLLAAEPLEARGFVILAEAEALQGHRAAAGMLFAIAARRGPRELRAHAWLVQDFLVTGRYDDALRHIEVILRVAPWQVGTVLPWLTRLSADPAFARSLARTLQADPPWRAHLLSMLHRDADPRARNAVLSELSRLRDLSEPEAAEWIDRLIQQGHWTTAYGVWASRLDPKVDTLTTVFNGDFESPVAGSGFDWHRPAISGVSTQLVPAQSAGGRVAHVVFRDRAVAQVDLEHPLLLAPGRYRFSARMRARGLRSDSGLEWSLTCNGQAEPIVASETLAGSFEWREVTREVTVPHGCLGQWLRLRNRGSIGLNLPISGEVWFDDVALKRQNEPNGPATDAPSPGAADVRPEGSAVLRVEGGRTMVSRGSGFASVETPAPLAVGERVLVLDGSIASLDYGEGCRHRLSAADVHVVLPRCPARSADADAFAPVDAARLAAKLEVAQAILQDMDPRTPVPAGR